MSLADTVWPNTMRFLRDRAAADSITDLLWVEAPTANQAFAISRDEAEQALATLRELVELFDLHTESDSPDDLSATPPGWDEILTQRFLAACLPSILAMSAGVSGDDWTNSLQRHLPQYADGARSYVSALSLTRAAVLALNRANYFEHSDGCADKVSVDGFHWRCFLWEHFLRRHFALFAQIDDNTSLVDVIQQIATRLDRDKVGELFLRIRERVLAGEFRHRDLVTTKEATEKLQSVNANDMALAILKEIENSDWVDEIYCWHYDDIDEEVDDGWNLGAVHPSKWPALLGGWIPPRRIRLNL
jgi:hypothetical protein